MLTGSLGILKVNKRKNNQNSTSAPPFNSSSPLLHRPFQCIFFLTCHSFYHFIFHFNPISFSSNPQIFRFSYHTINMNTSIPKDLLKCIFRAEFQILILSKFPDHTDSLGAITQLTRNITSLYSMLPIIH